MRAVSILELCLLALLFLCINALQLSVKDLAVGFGLGFGLMSANDFITVFITGHPSLNAPLQFAYQAVIFLHHRHVGRLLHAAGASTQARNHTGQFYHLSLE